MEAAGGGSDAWAPRIMGILNVTPDSFSDGGSYEDVGRALAHATELMEQGADIIDIGGESTRPGAERIDPEDERRRVLPVVRELADRRIPVSIDTVNAGTAAEAVAAGALIVNDVSGGLADPGMAEVVADSGVHFVAMHWRGAAGLEASYGDVVREVREELRERIAELVVAGLRPEQIIIDPGLGFAKDAEHNWALLGRLPELVGLGHGVLVGASRKRFLGALLPEGAAMRERDAPTAVVSALAAQAGAWAVRVHDVRATRTALDVWTAWERGRLGIRPEEGGA
ncbi:dihydropteroate synthase [Homoserinibacter sp. YIM 151385]|uniref:dihydropteroate synthase n=1 Tax=Homoserinibacter sp. YIM 151385 TaxID=2985506 RepID=UPI0022F061DC|nr:dihydropteroate synthase [Homoserinibacter sp. YIM 151385]WBU37551.1 dihydropteroate synthase [Homoserinibacter sp. YIM 151385]